MSDVWEMGRAIVRERKSREIDPLLAMLRESVANADKDEADVKEKLQDMLDSVEAVVTIYNQVEQMPLDTLIKLASLGENFGKVLSKLIKS
jgi:DNA-binding transcriptional regulator GbsR (MarR family)